MEPSEPTPPSSVPPPLVPQSAPMPPPARRNRTVWIIVLIALGLLVLAASVVVPFFTSITTAEVLQVDKDIELPVARAEKKQEAPRAGEYFLNLKWENGKGVFRFLDKDYEDEQALVAELEKVRTSVPGCRLIVRGDQRLPAIEIQRAMKVMSSAGFDAITFSTADPK